MSTTHESISLTSIPKVESASVSKRDYTGPTKDKEIKLGARNWFLFIEVSGIDPSQLDQAVIKFHKRDLSSTEYRDLDPKEFSRAIVGADARGWIIVKVTPLKLVEIVAVEVCYSERCFSLRSEERRVGKECG